MGREIIVKPLQFPAAIKEHRVFLFVGPEDLNDVDFAIKSAQFLSELALPEHLRLSFFAPVALGRLGCDRESSFDQAAAVLFHIRDKFPLPVVTNLGDWKNLEKVTQIAQVIFVDDFLVLNKNRLVEFFKLGKPSILDTHLLVEAEIKELIALIDQYKAPSALLKRSFSPQDLGLIDNYFISARLELPDIRLAQSFAALGVKGFCFSCRKDTRDLEFVRELVKIF